jgi:predicted hydrocarbon binding protein
MGDEQDFDRGWLVGLASCLDASVGEDVRRQVMRGADHISGQSSRRDVVDWTAEAMRRLEHLVGSERAAEVMTGCSCRYPVEELAAIRERYQATGDVGVAHGMLLEQFEAFLRDTLALDEEQVTTVIGRGWGLAGVRQGNTIVATKIPKSQYLTEYLAESDPERRRQLYCHCPRVREAIGDEVRLPEVYCYCGAGFYKHLWEEILQQPVQVEVLSSVLAGDDVCSIAIHLPDEA